MSELLKRIENEALSLTSSDSPIIDIEAVWLAEAKRRYEEYKKGNRAGLPANKVFAEADLILK